MKIFFIGLGGAIGAIARYMVSGWVYAVTGAYFPWGTFVINLTGSLFIGFLWGAFEEASMSHNMRMFFIVGLLGSFTTFSTFSFENVQLIRDSEFGLMGLNIAISVVGGIAMVFIGMLCVRLLMTSLR
ncbi:MAG: fluoride efflux transporter CrcB [Candidatus Omnitrophica bacterium]|nr:fluoride efflux transporter CrcB [Candidatus Omnitrophota bacterium]